MDDKSEVVKITLLEMIEKNYRLLSSDEIQFLFEWQDNFDDDIIFECVKRASDFANLNIAYMRSIFINWQKKNVKTLDDIGKLDKIHIEKKNKWLYLNDKRENRMPRAFVDLIGGTSYDN